MAEIGIITFLHNDNYGSSLQAYALQRVITEMGHSCEHIDYMPDRNEKIRNILHCGNDPKLILEGMRKRSVKAGQEAARKKSEAIPEFYARRMKLSPRCANHRQLAEVCKKYDILVCGSDQIWNPVWLNTAYFLDFAREGQRKTAYAASLGVSEMPPKRKADMIRRLTEDFEAVSVREEAGAALMRQITGREPDVMPDPVCLLTREEWLETAGADAADKAADRYLLCYFIGEDPKYWEKVRELREKTGLEVRVMPVTAESFDCGYRLTDGKTPEDFIRTLAGAEMLCTDSFHGLAFGTVFGRKTELIRRYRDDDRESKNSRVDDFLRHVNGEGLDSMRERGLRWLKEKLG